MPISFNGNDNIEKIIFNSVELTEVFYDGVKVWDNIKPVTEFWIKPSANAYVGFSIGGSWEDPGVSKPIEYSFDRETWTSTNVQTLYNEGTPSNFISVNANQKIYWRSNNKIPLGGGEWSRYVFSVLDSTKTNEIEYDIGGMYNSLYNYELDKSSDRYSSCRVFWNTLVVDASECVLPYSQYVGERLFEGCTHLIYAPQIEKPKLQTFLPCLDETFAGCTSLITIPQFSGLYSATGFDWGLFTGCTALKFSETQTAECPNAYRIPNEGTWEDQNFTYMSGAFSNTSGTYTGDLYLGTTYYTNAEIVPEYEGYMTPWEYFYIGAKKYDQYGNELTTSGQFKFTDVDANSPVPIDWLVSYDKSTWTQFQKDTYYTITPGSKLYFKAGQNGNTGTVIPVSGGDTPSSRLHFEHDSQALLCIGGDITTLLTADGNVDNLNNYGMQNFAYLFRNTGTESSQWTAMVMERSFRVPCRVLSPYAFWWTFRNAIQYGYAPEFKQVEYVGCYSFGTTFYECGFSAGEQFDFSGIKGTTDGTNYADDCTYAITYNSSHYPFRNAFKYGGISGAVMSNMNPTNYMYKDAFNTAGSMHDVKVGWTSFDTGSGTNGWLYGAGSGEGRFYCPTALGTDSTITRSGAACPAGWTVINTD